MKKKTPRLNALAEMKTIRLSIGRVFFYEEIYRKLKLLDLIFGRKSLFKGSLI